MPALRKNPRALDHFVILIEKIEPAVQAYQRLGFNVRPIARHLSIGSCNSVIHLEHTYLELLDVSEAPQFLKDQYEPRLAAGPGLTHVAVHSDSLEADQARLAAAGLNPGTILNARRKMTFPDGREGETASSSMYCWRQEHRYLSIFVSVHNKPETIFVDGHVNHANQARRIVRCVFQSEDPALDIDYFETLYEGRVSDRTIDGFRFAGPHGDVTEVITPAVAAARYGDAMPARGLAGLGALPLALHYAVASLEGSANCLRAADVPFTRTTGALIVPAAEACGVTTVFEAL